MKKPSKPIALCTDDLAPGTTALVAETKRRSSSRRPRKRSHKKARKVARKSAAPVNPGPRSVAKGQARCVQVQYTVVPVYVGAGLALPCDPAGQRMMPTITTYLAGGEAATASPIFKRAAGGSVDLRSSPSRRTVDPVVEREHVRHPPPG